MMFPVPRCGLPPSRLMVKSQKGHANVASPCRLLDSYRKNNPAPLTRHTGINQPAFSIPNFSQSNQESPPRSLQRKKLNQVDEYLQGPLDTQVAAIHHRACLLETAGFAIPRVEPQICHSNVGPLPLNMAIKYKCTSQTLLTRRTRERDNTHQIPTHRTQTITLSLPT
jgi:hypothetical protein